MSDTRERELEREAASGDPTALTRWLCYRISHLGQGTQIRPEFLEALPLGWYDGQRVIHSNNTPHPVFRWRTGSTVTTEFGRMRHGDWIDTDLVTGERFVGRIAPVTRGSTSPVFPSTSELGFPQDDPFKGFG